MTKTSLEKELKSLGIISQTKIFHRGVRDDKKINVLQCTKSGVLFLDQIKDAKYESLDDLSYWGKAENIKWKTIINEDDRRRAKMLKPIVKNGKWLDVGTGLGSVLHLCQKSAKVAHALEPQTGAQVWLKKHFHTFSSIEECSDEYYDVITLFHVFEHISNPYDFLQMAYQKLKKGGIIILEVPHARDALIEFYQSEAFKQFTFWSQHLILHTKFSLKTYLKSSGFKQIEIENFQRYDMSNHLYWLSQNKPGGHEVWKQQFGTRLKRQYQHFLYENNLTDTIIAYSKK